MQKFYLYVVLLALFCWMSVTPVHATVNSQEQPTEDMWIDLSLLPELVDDFNQIARNDDIARIDHISRLDALDGITEGKRLVIFKSVADAQDLLPHIGDQFDIIGYNLEHGPSNSPAEQAEPVESVIRMRELADQYDKELALGPDHDFALSHGAAMAPFVDMFILQVQRVQTDPQTVREFVVPLASQFQRVNPDLKISVQIRTEGDVTQLRQLIESLQGSIDGISILTSPETIDFAEELLAELRPQTALLGRPTPVVTAIVGQPTATSTAPAAAPTESPDLVGSLRQYSSTPQASRPTSTPASTQTSTQPLPQNNSGVSVAQSAQAAPREQSAPAGQADPVGESALSLQSWKAYSLVAIGCLSGGLLIASVMYAYQKFSSRP